MRAETNALLTQTGPDTPMGDLMREFWMPALLSSELDAGGDPVRLRLLGENWLAFRSPEGKVGIIDHQCAHRCASLFYGRNEDGGIRCVYHGWKFDHDGQCVDMPSEPPETDFKRKVKMRSARTAERYGVVWAYFGQRETPPPLPEFDLDKLPDGQEPNATFMMRECNWLQALEGDIDTCHVGFLHLGGVGPEYFEEGSLNYYRQMPSALSPKYEAMATAYGAIYSAYRPAGPNTLYHRIGQFGMPFWTMAPSEPLNHVKVRAWVPIDDENSMLITIGGERTPTTKGKNGKPVPGTGDPIKFLPNTSDWLGRWRVEPNLRNDHLISREEQKTGGSYTGIKSIPMQDQAVTESMGTIVDRTKEHLGTSDQMITLCRRLLVQAVQDYRDRGEIPPQIDNPECYRNVRAGFVALDEDADWLDHFNDRRSQWSDGTARPIERSTRRAALADT